MISLVLLNLVIKKKLAIKTANGIAAMAKYVILKTGAIEYEITDNPSSQRSTTKKFLDKMVFTGHPFNKWTIDKINNNNKTAETARKESLWLLSVKRESDEGKNILSYSKKLTLSVQK